MFNNIDEQINSGKQKAQDLLSGKNLDDNSIIFLMRFTLGKIIGKSVFDPFFEQLTPEDLAFELELYTQSNKDQNTKTSEIIEENKEEISELFDDMADEDITDNFEMSEEELSRYTDFMNTGEFTEEKK